MIHQHSEEAFQIIDADIFSSDAIEDNKYLNRLFYFIDRWSKTLHKQIEKRATSIGELTNKVYGWTDKELEEIIRMEKLVVAFFEGKGEKWWLQRAVLRNELLQFEDYLEARKNDKLAR